MNTEGEKRITKARVQLLLRKPFFGFLATHLIPIENNHMLMPTMGTDGEHLYYDSTFIEGCSNTDLQTIICHEVLHAALSHVWRRGEREPIRWNISADSIVNWHLEQQGFNLPDGVIKIPEAANLSTEEMYLKIKNVESIVGKVIDDHGSWGKPIGKGKAGGESKDKGDSSDGSSKEMTDIATQLAAAEREAKALEEKWKQLTAQARQIEKSQGRGMGSLEELIDELIEPRLSWKEILRNMITSAVKNDYRIIPPNKKHLWRGIYLPSIYGEEIEIGYAVDTSGSMSTGEVKEGLSELKGICDSFQGYKIHMWQCDDGIQQYAELTPYNFDFPKKIRGRGGTSFCPVFEDIDKKGIRLGCLVYFTDGWGTIPTTRPYYPVVWLISNEGITKDSSYWQDLEKIGQIIEYKRQVK